MGKHTHDHTDKVLADRRWFFLCDEEWDKLMEALEIEEEAVYEMPKLHDLLTHPNDL